VHKSYTTLRTHTYIIEWRKSHLTRPFCWISWVQWLLPLRIYVHTYTVSDWGVCNWPWRWFALGKDDYPFLVTSNHVFQLKNTLGLKCSRILCVWDNTVIFCSVLYGTAVRKFDVMLVINETSNKWLTVEGRSCSYVFPSPRCAAQLSSWGMVITYCIHRCAHSQPLTKLLNFALPTVQLMFTCYEVCLCYITCSWPSLWITKANNDWAVM
jgi:hypothetical protein